MRANVKAFVRRAAQAFPLPEPVLEIGSRPAAGQEGYADLSPFFPDRRYIGSDFLPGPSVDVLLDAHLLGVRDGQIGTVLMMDTLEHVQDPLLAMREVHRILRPDGVVLMSSHMSFPLHNHPWDYWRYTPAAFDLIIRPFQARAVWCQGDPLAPHTVLALARKTAELDEQVAFDASVAALEESWPKEINEGPLIHFEPLVEAVLRDHAPDAGRALSRLVVGGTVEQTFICPADNLTRIDTKYVTHGRMSFCHLSFQLRDETANNVVAEGRYYGPHLVDGVWTPFAFPLIADSAGRRYRLNVSSWDARDDAPVSPLACDGAAGEGEELFQNGQKVSATLCLRVLCRTPDYSPADYRRLSGMATPVAADAAAGLDVESDLVRRVASTQSAHLWRVAARVEDGFDRTHARLDVLTADVREILAFVQSIRASGVYRSLQKARGLLRRNKGSG